MPAAATLDFPEPDGPTSAIRRAPERISAVTWATRASRPKKSPESSSRNARSPLYGFLTTISRGVDGRRIGEQRRVVQEDPLVQLPQRWRRHDTELVRQSLAMALVRAQRIDVAPGAVHREHDQFLAAVAQRILGDDCLGRAQRLVHLAQLELGTGETLEGVEAQVLQPPGRVLARTRRTRSRRGLSPARAPSADRRIAAAIGDRARPERRRCLRAAVARSEARRRRPARPPADTRAHA